MNKGNSDAPDAPDASLLEDQSGRGPTIVIESVAWDASSTADELTISGKGGVQVGRSETILSLREKLTIDGGENPSEAHHLLGDLYGAGDVVVEGSTLGFLSRQSYLDTESGGEGSFNDRATQVVARSLELTLANADIGLGFAGNDSNPALFIDQGGSLADPAFPQNFLFVGTSELVANLNGAPLFAPFIVVQQLTSENVALEFDLETFRKFLVEPLPEATGSTGSNVAEALAGAAPQMEVVVLPEGGIDAAVLELLLQVGIFARPSSSQEMLSADRSFTSFVQSLVEPNLQSFYYPRASDNQFLSLLEVVYDTRPNDFEVAEGRISNQRVRRAIERYFDVFWIRGADGEPSSPRTDELTRLFERSFESYKSTVTEPDGIGFAHYIERTGGEAAAILGSLRELFREVRALGLTPQELEVSYRVLVRPISGFGLSTEEWLKAIQGPDGDLAFRSF